MPTLTTAPAKMILPANRDLLMPQLIEKVRLNRYDMKFMVNILQKYLAQNEPLSTNQNELYEKIIHKYRKQFRKLQVNYKDVLAMDWANGIVSANTLKQKTFFRMAGETMQLYFNFNKAQIETVRALVHDDVCNHLNRGQRHNFGNGQKYDFTWDNTTKVWSGPFNIYLFRQLCDFVKTTHVKIDDSVQSIVSALDASSKDEWTPGIRVVHGRLYVNHIAETMLPFLAHIDPADLSMQNIEQMAKLGLHTPPDWDHIAEYITSVSPDTEHVLSTAKDVAVLKQYLNESDRNIVFHIPELQHTISDELADLQNCLAWGNSTLDFSKIDLSLSSNVEYASKSAETIDNIIEAGYTTLVTTTPLTNQLSSQSLIGKFALQADKVIYITLSVPN